EAGVEGTVGKEPGDADPAGLVVMPEEAGDDDLEIALQVHGIDDIVGATARVEGQIERAVGVKATDTFAIGIAQVVEIAAKQDFAVRLNQEGIEDAIGAGAGVEGRIERAVGIEPGNAIA